MNYMKIKVHFELDISPDSHLFQSIDDIKHSLTIITEILATPPKYYDYMALLAYATPTPESSYLQQYYLEVLNKDKNLAEQIFNNLTINGETLDGHSFYFNHTGADYKEKLIIDGQEQ